MPNLWLNQVTKQFGQILAVNQVELKLPAGQLISFLGPSGCGKTTLLRLIAGLETPDVGHISFDDRDVTHLPTHQRNLGMVFQSLALFPHLTVGENIAYGLRTSRASKAQQQQRVQELLELVHLPGMSDRSINQLSGGQQQRVAIARALARRPSLFLLDEPLSSLDAKLREAMQLDLRQLQQQLGITTILVTHDQREAMTMSDLVVVINRGQIKQIGSPLELYHHPNDTFVADFIGKSNFLRGLVRNASQLLIDGICFTGWHLAHVRPGEMVTISVRPEDVKVSPCAHEDHATKEPMCDRLPGVVTFIRDLGASVELHIDCGGLPVVSSAPSRTRPLVQHGDKVTVQFPVDACIVLRQ